MIESFEATTEWLKKYKVPYDLAAMRPDKFQEDSWPIADGNPATKEMRYMSDDILKKKMLDTFIDIDEVFLVIDDRDKAVKMWRKLGLNTFQVAPGNFNLHLASFKNSLNQERIDSLYNLLYTINAKY